jgi:hypothetical protein
MLVSPRTRNGVAAVETCNRFQPSNIRTRNSVHGNQVIDDRVSSVNPHPPSTSSVKYQFPFSCLESLWESRESGKVKEKLRDF